MAYVFNLNDKVMLRASREAGVVVGRAERSQAPESYLVAYTKANGQAYEEWLPADSITHPA